VPAKRTVLKAAHPIPPDAAEEGITLAETAYRSIRRDIISGELQPGQPLRLEALKQRYGLSFSPIREALNRLKSERLAVLVALRGFSVAPLSRDEIRDTIETRILIECDALRRALHRGGKDWETRIVAAFHALSWHVKRLAQAMRVPTAEEIEELEARHCDFHHALIADCGSPWLLDLADRLYAQTERYRRPTLIPGGATRGSRNVTLEHKQIMDATLNRDEARALSLLAEHYRRTATYIEKRMADERPRATSS
jgi:GntR family transcriptional regulator, carbon starvation induced regulator